MANTIITKNSATASAVPTSGDLVQGELAVNVTDKRLFTENSGGTVVELGTNPSQLNFADNAKAIFGAGSDLQIYHDGTHSRIVDAGTGNLHLQGDNLRLKTADSVGTYLEANNGGAVTITYNSIPKLATTSTGIDVTGTVVSDGLRVNTTQGDVLVQTDSSTLDFQRDGGSYIRATGTTGNFSFITGASTFSNKALVIASNNDIGFFEDTGTTAKFFWDASAESLGLGTAAPAYKLDVNSSSAALTRFNSTHANGGYLIIQRSGTSTAWVGSAYHTLSPAGSNNDTAITTVGAYNLILGTNTTERLRLDSAGNLGLGVTPSAQLASYKSFQFGIGGNLIGRSDSPGIELSSNSYRNTPGAYIYLNTDNSASYRQYSGQHQFFTAPSGTAGSAISFTQAMTLNASGSLSVGTTADEAKLCVVSSSQFDPLLARTTTSIMAGNTGGTSGVNAYGGAVTFSKVSSTRPFGAIASVQTTSDADQGGLAFFVHGSASTNDEVQEVARIDHSGNLLVGTTAFPSGSVTGFGFQGTSDYAYFARSGGEPLNLDRHTTDGNIAVFRKDGTTVGSIGSRSNGLYIAKGNTNIVVYDDGTTNSVFPESGSDPTRLGLPSAPFSDLYLSGGVYVGGTGAANHLDDYEEGTFTAQFFDADSGGNGSPTSNTGYYTKIGRMVYFNFVLVGVATTGMTAGNYAFFQLPFATSASFSAGFANLLVQGINWTNANLTSVSSWTGGGASRGRIAFLGDNTDYEYLKVSEINSGSGSFYISGTYMT